MKDNKQRSSKVLMILSLVMYINESALVALNWYFRWLGYVKYSGSEDQAAAIFWASEEAPLTVLYIFAVNSSKLSNLALQTVSWYITSDFLIL
jgi:hypothetical protein